MEDAIRQTDISKSVQRFQLAVDEAKVRLNLAISPGTWLMPSNLLINTQSSVGYNGIKLMDGGESKTKRPVYHNESRGENAQANTHVNKTDKNESAVGFDDNRLGGSQGAVLLKKNSYKRSCRYKS